MKEEIHPEYHPVVFVDVSTGDEVPTRSTVTSEETKEIDGVSHYVIRCDITAFTHPFYTGKQKLVDTEGRIERFRRKYREAQERGGKKKKRGKKDAGQASEETTQEGSTQEASSSSSDS